MAADLNDATPRTRAALTRSEQQLARQTGPLNTTRSLNRQRILTEDEYTEGLERIIARDFFPMLSERMRQRDEEEEVLRGFRSSDPDVIERSVRRMEGWVDATPAWSERFNSSNSDKRLRRDLSQTPQMLAGSNQTPLRAFGETPVIPSASALRESRLRYDPSLTLDDFQAKYTSEDNASFAQIVNDENDVRRTKYAWAYKAEQESNDRSRRAIEAREKLVDLAKRLTEGDSEVRLIEGAEPGRPGARLLIEGRESLPGDSASREFAKRRLLAAPTEKQRLMIEDGKEKVVATTAAEREQQLQIAVQESKKEADQQIEESQTAGTTQAWKSTTRNNLYYLPDANLSIHEAGRLATEQAKKAAAAVDELGITEPKGIRYSSTRMFLQEELEEAARKAGVPPSPSRSNIAAAISGTPYPGRADASMTPRVQGYSFVDDMPSPSPSQLGSGGVNSLMTFGTILSTPVALRDPNADDPALKKPSDDPDFEGPFKIPKTSRRENLAHKMASKATKSLQQRHGMSFGSSGLALRKGVESDRFANYGESPKDASVRAAQRQMEEEGRTPARDAFLSPAAKTLLGRTTSLAKADVASSLSSGLRIGLLEEHDPRGKDKEKWKRARWDPSPQQSSSSRARR